MSHDSSKTIIPFPVSKARPASRSPVLKKTGPAKDLGLTQLSKDIGTAGRSAMGHWCSHCGGIWYTYFLEVECPRCGNRHG